MRDVGAERGRVLAELAAALRQWEFQRSGQEAFAQQPVRRGSRRAGLNHWYHPGRDTPWWVYGLRLGFWLLIAAGVETVGEGGGWHPNPLAATLGVAEVAWRARAKIRASRHV